MSNLSFGATTCQVGWLTNAGTGEVVPALCKCWSCQTCGPRRVRAFIRRVAPHPVSYFVTLTAAGSGEASAENIKQFNRSFRSWKQFLARHCGVESYTWVNEQGAKTGRLHKHLMVKTRRRMKYSSARSALVRCGLGKVCDFQLVRCSNQRTISSYVSKSLVSGYLAKNLSANAWPKGARRVQTTHPRPKPSGIWIYSPLPTFYRESLRHQRMEAERIATLNDRDEREALASDATWRQPRLALIHKEKLHHGSLNYGPD